MFTAQDQLVQVKLSRLQAVVGLYQALGGGWTESEDLKTQRVSALDASARQDSAALAISTAKLMTPELK
jgi:hypothetical protein